jgi:hypothetical protein
LWLRLFKYIMIKFTSSAIVAFIVFSGSVSASPERYPTNSEIKTLRQQLRQQLKKFRSDEKVSHYVTDRRSPSQRQSRDVFIDNWSKVNPLVSPFLGLWSGDFLFYIYPSKIRQKVCVISADEGHYSFRNSRIYNGAIIIGDGQILFKEGLHLGMGGIRDGKPQLFNDIPYSSPTLPPSIVEIINLSEGAERNLIRQGFKENGCISPTSN